MVIIILVAILMISENYIRIYPMIKIINLHHFVFLCLNINKKVILEPILNP